MYWFCDRCSAWGAAETEVDAAADRIRHSGEHSPTEPDTTEPQQESVEGGEDTVLGAKYLAWGITALLGLLSAHWHALAGVVPLAALYAWVVTQPNSEGE